MSVHLKHCIAILFPPSKENALKRKLNNYSYLSYTNFVSRIPNALPGRDSTELKIFGMQGVPKQFVEEKVLTGAAKYWNNVINEKNKLLKKDEKKEKKEAPKNVVDDKKKKAPPNKNNLVKIL